MHFRGFPQPARRSFLLILQVTLALISWTSALQIAYCSPENNGDDQYWYTWMSNGECHDHCVQSNSVFAIIQDKYCWCSNDVPADTVNTGQCNSACPGYPNDTCGNAAVGLYGYFQIGGMPSGTSGGSSPTTASSLSAETSSSPVDSSTSTRKTSSSTLTSSSITSAPTSSTTSAPKTIIQTEQGVTTTIILSATSTPSGDALGSGSQFRSSGGGLNGGQVAGIVIGCTLGVGALIAAAVFFWLRRRHRRNTEAMSEVGGFGSPTAASKTSNTGIPSRQVSQMSSAGLLSKATRSNTGGFSTRQGAGGNGPETDRNSSHLAVDQRLNPWAIYSNDDSRMSNVSLQDNHDYSRQLRVANPDP